MHASRPLTMLLPAALTAAALAGCGLDAHRARTVRSAPTRPTSTLAAASDDPSDGPPSTTPAQVTTRPGAAAPAPAGAASPESDLERYADTYINWTAATLRRSEEQLAARSLGQARAQAQQAAANGGDGALAASRVTNRGSVLSIAPGAGPAYGQWVIVTREITSGRGAYAGLPAADHVIYAHLTDTGRGWVVDQWSPQS